MSTIFRIHPKWKSFIANLDFKTTSIEEKLFFLYLRKCKKIYRYNLLIEKKRKWYHFCHRKLEFPRDRSAPRSLVNKFKKYCNETN